MIVLLLIFTPLGVIEIQTPSPQFCVTMGESVIQEMAKQEIPSSYACLTQRTTPPGAMS